jgi:peroxiredoxin
VADNIDGKPIQLSKLRGDWVMLVFVERRDSLLTLEPMARALKSMNVNTVTVCWDKAQSLKNFLKGRDLGLLALADPTGEIVALYGLLNPLRDQSEPGFVLINPIGDVRLALLGLDLPNADASRLVEFAVTGE